MIGSWEYFSQKAHSKAGRLPLVAEQESTTLSQVSCFTISQAILCSLQEDETTNSPPPA
jgi:hypothetical protein